MLYEHCNIQRKTLKMLEFCGKMGLLKKDVFHILENITNVRIH